MGKYLVCIEYFWPLNVQGQVGVILVHFQFDDLVSTSDLNKYSRIFAVLSLYITDIILTSKGQSRNSRSLGLLFTSSLLIYNLGIGIFFLNVFLEYLRWRVDFRYNRCLGVFATFVTEKWATRNPIAFSYVQHASDWIFVAFIYCVYFTVLYFIIIYVI